MSLETSAKLEGVSNTNASPAERRPALPAIWRYSPGVSGVMPRSLVEYCEQEWRNQWQPWMCESEYKISSITTISSLSSTILLLSTSSTILLLSTLSTLSSSSQHHQQLSRLNENENGNENENENENGNKNKTNRDNCHVILRLREIPQLRWILPTPLPSLSSPVLSKSNKHKIY